MTSDVLDDVMLSAAAADGWRKICQSAVCALRDSGITLDVDDYGVESATVEADGSLALRAKIGETGSLCMKVPAEHWCWAASKARLS